VTLRVLSLGWEEMDAVVAERGAAIGDGDGGTMRFGVLFHVTSVAWRGLYRGGLDVACRPQRRGA